MQSESWQLCRRASTKAITEKEPADAWRKSTASKRCSPATISLFSNFFCTSSMHRHLAFSHLAFFHEEHQRNHARAAHSKQCNHIQIGQHCTLRNQLPVDVSLGHLSRLR